MNAIECNHFPKENSRRPFWFLRAENLSDALRTAESASADGWASKPCRAAYNPETKSEDGDMAFSGAYNFAEALRFLRDPDSVDVFRRRGDLMMESHSRLYDAPALAARRAEGSERDFFGDRAEPSRAAAGAPNAMRRRRKTKRNIISVLANISMPCTATRTDFDARIAGHSATIAALDAAGMPSELWATGSTYRVDEISSDFLAMVRVKEAGEYASGASIISAFSQPFYRKIIFALKYRFIPNVEEGLGTPNRFREALKQIQTNIDRLSFDFREFHWVDSPFFANRCLDPDTDEFWAGNGVRGLMDFAEGVVATMERFPDKYDLAMAREMVMIAADAAAVLVAVVDGKYESWNCEYLSAEKTAEYFRLRIEKIEEGVS